MYYIIMYNTIIIVGLLFTSEVVLTCFNIITMCNISQQGLHPFFILYLFSSAVLCIYCLV